MSEAMASSGEKRSDDGKGDRREGDDDRTWSKVVQGASRSLTWTSHRISPEEIEQLQAFFSTALELPATVLEASRR